MDFNDISQSLVSEHFDNLSRAVGSLSPTARSEYASKFSLDKSIWVVAGMTEETSFPISMN